jgi:hypothetical protein
MLELQSAPPDISLRMLDNTLTREVDPTFAGKVIHDGRHLCKNNNESISEIRNPNGPGHDQTDIGSIDVRSVIRRTRPN